MYKARYFIIVFSVLILCGYAGTVFAGGCHESKATCSIGQKAADNEAVINTVCPVMQGDVEPDTTAVVQYKGKKIGFCCPGCVDMFKADPEKYASNIEKAG